MRMPLRIMVSRHSAFYSPLIATIAGGYLEKQGLGAEYSVLGEGLRFIDLIRNGVVDLMQSAVSSNWKPIENGEMSLPVHFAQINQRDGFYIVAREPDSSFEWKKLEGRAVLADHGWQPITMLKYAVRRNGAEWARIQAVDAGAPQAMEQAFRKGVADYVHLQAPAPRQLERDRAGYIVASVGASMPAVAFSSLCCSREFLRSSASRAFLHAFREAKEWVRSASPEEIADIEASFFPEFSREALSESIRDYQTLGCWQGDTAIPRDLYEQALNVFEADGQVRRRHAYETVCVLPE